MVVKLVYMSASGIHHLNVVRPQLLGGLHQCEGITGIATLALTFLLR
nr:MAG TPA: hypothetical protein [Caudoviricetes sp.]